MAEDRTRADSATPDDAFSPGEDTASIGQLELADIWLQAARVANHHDPGTPEESSLAMESGSTCESGVEAFEGFAVAQTYVARFERGETARAEVEVTFGLRSRQTTPEQSTWCLVGTVGRGPRLRSGWPNPFITLVVQEA